jgi:hypothetical protein
MSLSEFTCIALGMLFNTLTFFLGVAVGVNVSQKRKESPHDRDRYRYEAEGFQHYTDDSED